MSLIYALVAKDTVILAKHQFRSGSHDLSQAMQAVLYKVLRNDGKLTGTYVWEQYLIHYLSQGGYTYLLMADDRLGRRIPYTFLAELQQKFNATVQPSSSFSDPPSYSIRESFEPVIEQLMSTYATQQLPTHESPPAQYDLPQATDRPKASSPETGDTPVLSTKQAESEAHRSPEEEDQSPFMSAAYKEKFKQRYEAEAIEKERLGASNPPPETHAPASNTELLGEEEDEPHAVSAPREKESKQLHEESKVLAREKEQDNAIQYAEKTVQCALPTSRSREDDLTILQLCEKVGHLENLAARSAEDRYAEQLKVQAQMVSMGKEVVDAKEKAERLEKELVHQTKQNARLKEAVQAIHRASALEHLLNT